MRKAIFVYSSVFRPLNNSGAIMMGDLVDHFLSIGHSVVLFVPNASGASHAANDDDFVLVRCPSPWVYSHNSFLRLIGELVFGICAFTKSLLLFLLRKSKVDLILVYSPSPFSFIGMVWSVFFPGIKSTLVLRDLFPYWAFKKKILSKNSLAGIFFRFMFKCQLFCFDKLGVESTEQISFVKCRARSTSNVFHLPNWSEPIRRSDDLDFAGGKTSIESILKDIDCEDRHIAVYAGNFGTAQGFNHFLEILEVIGSCEDWFFLFIGGGLYFEDFKKRASRMGLTNVLVRKSVPAQIVDRLCLNCDVGLVFLDPDASLENIPGKLSRYAINSLPSVAICSRNSNLDRYVRANGIGFVGHSWCALPDALLQFRCCDSEGIKRNLALLAAESSVSNATARILDLCERVDE